MVMGGINEGKKMMGPLLDLPHITRLYRNEHLGKKRPHNPPSG